MAELANALATINAKEIEANENALAQCFPQPPGLSSEAQQLVVPFILWTEMQRVRALPARPTSVAAFAQWQRDLGVSKEKINATLAAIEAMHFAAALANPCATPLVRITTAASTIEAPRSWTKDAKQLFTELPVEIQAMVAKRERERERELRRMQNEVAELKKRSTGGTDKPADNERNTEMAKKEGHEKGVGPYAGGDKDSKVTRDESARDYPKPRDIFNRIDETTNDGFAAKLPKSK